jgi:hypothetical protein
MDFFALLIMGYVLYEGLSETYKNRNNDTKENSG